MRWVSRGQFSFLTKILKMALELVSRRSGDDISVGNRCFKRSSQLEIIGNFDVIFKSQTNTTVVWTFRGLQKQVGYRH